MPKITQKMVPLGKMQSLFTLNAKLKLILFSFPIFFYTSLLRDPENLWTILLLDYDFYVSEMSS